MKVKKQQYTTEKSFKPKTEVLGHAALQICILNSELQLCHFVFYMFFFTSLRPVTFTVSPTCTCALEYYLKYILVNIFYCCASGKLKKGRAVLL